MCPACFATAAWIAGSLTSTGAFAVVAMRAFSTKRAAAPAQNTSPNPSSNAPLQASREEHHD